MLEEFLRRLPETEVKAREIVATVFAIPSTIREKVSAIRADNRLTDAAKAEDIRSMALGPPIGHLKQIRSAAHAMTTSATNLRKTFAPPTPDRADLFGEAQRAELRMYIRGLPDGQRLRAVISDPALTEAVLLAHPGLSGLSTIEAEDGAPSQFDVVRDRYLETKFGAQIAGLEASEEVIAVVNAAIQIATSMIGREAGLTEAQLDAALAA